MNKKGIVAKNIVEIIIAVLCVLLVLGVAQKVFGSQDIYAVGASGAIFALAGLLAVLTPKLKV